MVEKSVYILFVFAIVLSISFFVIAIVYLKFVEKRIMQQIAAEKAQALTSEVSLDKTNDSDKATN